MSQTSAPLREMVPGRLGLNAEPHNPTDIVSKLDSDGNLFVGRGVIHDTGAGVDQIKHPDAGSQTLAGVIVASHAMESGSESPALDPHYPQKITAPLMKKGKIWVAIDEDVAVGDGVFFRHTGGDEGKFRTDVDGGNADALTNARWAEGGTLAQGIALLELGVL